VDVKNTWIEPGHNDLLPTQGTLFNGSAGVDYKLNDKVVLGLVSSFESSDTDTGGLFTGNTDSHGFGGGAYAGITLADNLIFNAMATGTWIDTDNTYTGISANVDSSRVQLSGGLTKYWYIGQTRITPSVQISWSKEYQDSFVDSTSALNPEQTLESAIATSGTTIGHTFALSNGQTIEPWIAGNLDWTIYSEIKTDGIGKTNLGEFLDARIQAGFNWSIAQNAQFTASGEIGGLIHPDQDTYAGELNLAIQF
jgi:outer membrane autotransporter protein